MSTIAKTPEAYFLTILSNLTRIVICYLVGEYVTRIVPEGTHEWSQYINSEEVERILGGEAQVMARAGVMITNPITLEMGEFPNWMRGNYMMMFKRL